MDLAFADDSNMNQSALEVSMGKFEQTYVAAELDQMKKCIKQSTELDSPEKHNLIVDLNIAKWEKSRSLKIYSLVALILLTLS